MNRQDLQNRFVDLTQTILPSMARTHRWSVREAHCFTRIVLDHLFADCWYHHIDHKLRAHKELNDTQLAQAVAIAERMRRSDGATIDSMDAQSLEWREQPKPNTVKSHPSRLSGV